jgi:hypothetical protein
MARPILAILFAITLTFAAATQAAVTTPLDQPLWSELTPQQRQVLAPLAKDWDATEPFRRKKWVGIAQRYPSMTPEQQQRVQGQMKTWANMSPEERNLARQKFKQLNKASPEQRATVRKEWEQYKELSEADKQQFKQHAAKKKAQKRSSSNLAPRPLTQPPQLPVKPAPTDSLSK